MSDFSEKYSCDTCGSPATQWARDLVEVGQEQGFAITEYKGEPKFGCERHPVESETQKR